jgi:hypothetical protein
MQPSPILKALAIDAGARRPRFVISMLLKVLAFCREPAAIVGVAPGAAS